MSGDTSTSVSGSDGGNPTCGRNRLASGGTEYGSGNWAHSEEVPETQPAGKRQRTDVATPVASMMVPLAGTCLKASMEIDPAVVAQGGQCSSTPKARLAVN
jgi:hypothetical protein